MWNFSSPVHGRKIDSFQYIPKWNPITKRSDTPIRYSVYCLGRKHCISHIPFGILRNAIFCREPFVGCNFLSSFLLLSDLINFCGRLLTILNCMRTLNLVNLFSLFIYAALFFRVIQVLSMWTSQMELIFLHVDVTDPFYLACKDFQFKTIIL